MREIDYDEVLCEEGLTLIIKGKKYEVKAPSLLQIFAFEKMTGDLVKAKTMSKIVAQIKGIIRTVFDTVPDEVLDKCSLKVLRKMLEDVREVIQQTMFPGVSKEEITDKKKTVDRYKAVFEGFARLARVYGWTHNQVGALTSKQFWAYLEAADVIMAGEQLRAIQVVTYPLMKDRDRQKVFSGYMKIIDPMHQEKQIEASMAKLDMLKSKFGYKGKR